MGLAGRKEKQRIPNDPRNLSWADDANKFGAAYLQKLGWSAGSGLGASGDGRTTHIKVTHKLDMLGIGAAHQKDPNGIAWKQNKDFENLLRRLNAANGEGEEEGEVPKIDGFAKAKADVEGDQVEDTEEGSSSKKRKRDAKEDDKEKRKKSRKGDVEDSSKEKKKNKNKTKSKAKVVDADERQPDQPAPEETVVADIPQPTPVVARPLRAHRARFLASKRLASKSSAAIDEILGISRSATATPYSETSTPSTPLDTPSDEPDTPQEDLKLQELTTSTKSVMDYFKEKLLAKSNGASTSSTPMSATSTSTPCDDDEDDYDDRPRGLGLGFSRSGLGAGSSKLRSEITFAETAESDRIGIGMFSRLSTTFSSSTTEATTKVKTTEVEEVQILAVEEGSKRGEKKKKDKTRKKTESGDRMTEENVKKRKSKKQPDDSEGEPAPLRKTRKEKQKITVQLAERELGDPAETTAIEISSGPKAKKEKKSKRKADVNRDDRVGADVEESKLKKKKKSSKRKDVEVL